MLFERRLCQTRHGWGVRRREEKGREEKEGKGGREGERKRKGGNKSSREEKKRKEKEKGKREGREEEGRRGIVGVRKKRNWNKETGQKERRVRKKKRQGSEKESEQGGIRNTYIIGFEITRRDWGGCFPTGHTAASGLSPEDHVLISLPFVFISFYFLLSKAAFVFSVHDVHCKLSFSLLLLCLLL